VSGPSRRPKDTVSAKAIQPEGARPAKANQTRPSVRAAGGAVWRRVPTGVEVVLVHRPAYDDWAFAKGKLEPGETDEEAGVREVREETGLPCRLGAELPSTTYIDGQGRPKMVRYWAMTVVRGPEVRGPVVRGPVVRGGVASGGVPTVASSSRESPSDAPLAPEPKARREVDEVRWFSLENARRRLTYPRDVVVLDALSDLLSRSDIGGQQVD
jgi:8-oxo-dGTP pyrophosphatase MutT (NUDIX family)